jgi:integrase
MGWREVDLVHKATTVGRSKTRGGEGRVIPLNDEAFEVLMEWKSHFEKRLRRQGSPQLSHHPGTRKGCRMATLLFSMVGEAGIEPTTPGLEGRCSIRLSYSPALLLL